jgi:hypothetical protein
MEGRRTACHLLWREGDREKMEVETTRSHSTTSAVYKNLVS